jgi:hypothetical protein
MRVSEAATAESGDIGETRDGEQDSKLLLTGKPGTPGNYKFNITRAVSEWVAPRHHHNFDQVRLPIHGEFVYGKDKILPPGWVGYFPAGVYYGPQIRRKDMLLALCQFGGAEGHGFLAKEQRKAAFERLQKKGRFENGAFIYTDAEGKVHKHDGSEAVYEEATGGKVTYPEPRYPEAITMNPASFSWMETDAPGVYTKWLGTFTEREFRLGFIKVEKGATVDGGLHRASEILFVYKGSIGHNGKDYPQYTAFGFEAKEGPIPLKAAQDTELFCVQLPKF